MIENAKNIWSSPDLHGELFLTPVKGYGRLFSNELVNESGMARALEITYIAIKIIAGAFVVPLLALVGMIVKCISALGGTIQRHNNDIKNQIRAEIEFVAPQFKAVIFSFSTTSNNFPFVDLVRKRYEVMMLQDDRNNGDQSTYATLERYIDSFSKEYRYVYHKTSGNIQNGFLFELFKTID